MNRLVLSCAVMALLSACATTPRPDRAVSFGEGDRVLAEFQDSGTWWAGTVSSVHDDLYAIAFDDQTTDEVSADEIEPLTWKHGSTITCSGTVGVIAVIAPGPRTLTLQDAVGTKIETTTAPCYEYRGID